jgi:membrane fusion protein (multidrug efflux system)
MAADFPRTLRSMEASRPVWRGWTQAAVVAGLAGWAAWFLGAPLGVYEVTGEARLEASGLARPAVSLRAGQVAANHLTLGESVEVGQVLLALDDRDQQSALETGRRRLAALRAWHASFDAEIAAERRAADDYRLAAEAQSAEQRSRLEQARPEAGFFASKFLRVRELRAQGATTIDLFEQAQSDADRTRLNIAVLEAAIPRLAADQAVEQSDRAGWIANLVREQEEVRAQIEEQTGRVQELELAVERCLVRAPTSGYIGRVGHHPPGAGVSAGEPVAYVVPREPPRGVAFFPVSAAGRIRADQPARLRLHGFPWTQYGSLPARVAHVANEHDAGALRVELDLEAAPNVPVPIEHGLSAAAEVLVERVTPATLVWRWLGRQLTAREAAGQAG